MLTDTAIRGAKSGRKPYKIFDRGGLFLLVNPGGSKLWRWRYRFDRKEKLMALGEYPVINLAQARELHFTARKTLAAGIDPMIERKAKAEAKQKEAETRQREAQNSFENIAHKWWEWWSVGKSPRHADYVMRRLQADVFPVIGHKFIDALSAADIRDLILPIEARGARDVAKRAHETIGQIFRYAIANGLAKRNPAADFKPTDILKLAEEENFARVDAKDLPALLAKMWDYDGDILTIYALQLMAYLWVRTTEKIEWTWAQRPGSPNLTLPNVLLIGDSITRGY